MIAAPGVYIIRHRETGQTYVGSTRNLAQRWKAHRHGLITGRHSNRVLQSAWNQHGEQAFDVTLVEPLAPDAVLLGAAEARWLNWLRKANVPLYSEISAGRSKGGMSLPGLRRMRLRRALTQEELAEKARVQRQTIIRLEYDGEAQPPTVRRLADALGCEPDDLYTDA